MKHKHADLMRLYSEDAQLTDKPWELWQVCTDEQESWKDLSHDPWWEPTQGFRRKPDADKLLDPYHELREAQKRGEVIEMLVCGGRWATAEEIGILKIQFVHPPDSYRIKPKTKTLYKWAYLNKVDRWVDTAYYYETEEEARKKAVISKGVAIKRLDYTAIEVEA